MLYSHSHSARRSNRLVLAVAVVASLATSAWSQTTWDGGGDGVSWHDANNWDTDTIPSASDHVIIDASPSTSIVQIDTPVEVASIDSGERLHLVGTELTTTTLLVEFNPQVKQLLAFAIWTRE